MTEPVIRPISPSDFNTVIDVLVRAFEDDPWFTFVATQDEHRLRRLRAWLRRGLVERTHPYGETFMTSDGAGIALWIPPIVADHDRFAELELRRALLRVAGWRRLRAVREAIRIVVEHEPARPHRELRILAVAPDRQHGGIGTALIRSTLDRCDRERVASALLCTKAQNVGFYQQFGFEVTSEVAIPAGPTLWQMWRDPHA